jgi:adenylate cyclase
MGRDEAGTFARLKAHCTERLEPALARNGGRLVKLIGDGALAEFGSAVDALTAAIEFQQAVAEANRDQPEITQIVIRVGLHLGDLIVDGDDLYGDGVNVAARLEGEAPPGGIVVSGDIHNAVVGRLKATLHDLGVLPLKNIERPVQAVRAEWNPVDWQMSAPSASGGSVSSQWEDVPLALPDKPSIAVLPFQNMSGDLEQEYFADGIDVEPLITRSLAIRTWAGLGVEPSRATGASLSQAHTMSPPAIRGPDSQDDLHSVHSTCQPLGVECMQCQHRAALAHDKIGAHSGNMKGVGS